jgi:hypothetical protein
MFGIGNGAPGSAALGDVTLVSESSGAACPGVSGLLLMGSPNSLPPPIDWRQVEDSVAFMCSHVTDGERLLIRGWFPIF